MVRWLAPMPLAPSPVDTMVIRSTWLSGLAMAAITSGILLSSLSTMAAWL